MSRYSRKPAVSPQTEQEADRVARATQRPGQTKEQTRLIAMGIRKGIDEYKKQQKAKQRELNKREKKQRSAVVVSRSSTEDKIQVETVIRQHWLPWMLLALSWIGFILFGINPF